MNRMNYWKKEILSEIQFFPQNLNYLFTNKKKAIYVGCTAMGNIGDEAILFGIRKLLSKKIHFYPISYKKPSSGRFFRKSLIFKSPNYIVLGGGTIIRKGENESYLRLMKQMQKQWPNAEVLVLGPGVANPEFATEIGFPTDIKAWTSFLNLSKFVSVRGPYSKLELESWGVRNPVHIFHDPVISFTSEKFVFKKKEKKIGLNFANIGDRIYGGNKETIKSFALAIVEKLLEDNWQIYLYPTTKSDLNYMLYDIGLSKFKSIKSYKNYKDLKASCDFLRSLDYLIGQRLHSIIFSSVVCTPFYALEYELKTKEFLKTIDMTSYSSRVDQLNVSQIYQELQYNYQNLDNIQNELHLKMQKVKEEQLNCRDLLLTKL